MNKLSGKVKWYCDDCDASYTYPKDTNSKLQEENIMIKNKLEFLESELADNTESEPGTQCNNVRTKMIEELSDKIKISHEELSANLDQNLISLKQNQETLAKNVESMKIQLNRLSSNMKAEEANWPKMNVPPPKKNVINHQESYSYPRSNSREEGNISNNNSAGTQKVFENDGKLKN